MVNPPNDSALIRLLSWPEDATHLSTYDLPITEHELDLVREVFSPTYYAAALGWTSGKSVSELLRHFLRVGMHEAIAPSPLFDPLIYEQRLKLAGHDLLEIEVPSFFHWLRHGVLRRIVPTAMFDEHYYLATNPDVDTAGLFGFEHFLRSGMAEGRAPNVTFDIAAIQHLVKNSGGMCWNYIDVYVQSRGTKPDLRQLFFLSEEIKTDVPVEPNVDHVEVAPSAGYSLAWRWRAGTSQQQDDPFRQYFEAVPMEGQVILAWAKRTTSSWPQPEDAAAILAAATRVQATDLFDADFYRTQVGSSIFDNSSLDPALHYVLVGEAFGFKPSTLFDPGYYGNRYPDVSHAGMILLLHYADYGRAEGRHGRTPAVSHVNPQRFDPARQNVIMAVHETSRTGAPILGFNIASYLAERYNVFTVLLGGGALTQEFEALSAETYGPFPLTQRDTVDLELGLRDLFGGRIFAYAILNSSETRRLVEVCARQLIPTIFLTHEFSSYVQFAAELRLAFKWATEIVFPAQTVARSSERAHPALKGRSVQILPQGMSLVPAGKSPPKPAPTAKLKVLLDARENGTFIVLGAGTVEIRKGVEFFIAAASAAQRLKSGRPIHFLWVGHGYNPTKDMGYSGYLYEQLHRSGLEKHVSFLSEVSDLEPIYALADAFLLSSRLDPLPNVSIDAAYRGIPVVCFRDASGTAELMLTDPITAAGVVPYLDAEAAGKVIVHLATDEAARQEISRATKLLAHEIFNMERYVERLDALGRNHASDLVRWHNDAETILSDESFDQDLFLGPQPIMESRRLSVARYLVLASRPAILDKNTADQDTQKDGIESHIDFAESTAEENGSISHLRRPAAGFSARLWSASHSDRMRNGENALADFIRAGRPEGPWQLSVLRPLAHIDPASQLKAVLHAYIPDISLAAPLLYHLRRNVMSCDLSIATGTEETALELRRMIASYRNGSVSVEVRLDGLGSFVASLARLATKYDVIGRVFSLPDNTNGVWREFQWQALLGGRHAMADRILNAFTQNSNLGVVFPAEPYVVSIAPIFEARVATLARDLGHVAPILDGADFPSGGMFWARTSVMRILMRLDALHQLRGGQAEELDEIMPRLVPIAADHVETFQAVSHVPGVFW